MIRRLGEAFVISGVVNSFLVWAVQPAHLEPALLIAWSLTLLETVVIGFGWRWA